LDWKELPEKNSELGWTWRRGQMSLDRELRSEIERYGQSTLEAQKRHR